MNFKKKNGHRKRDKLHGFRRGAKRATWRLDSVFRKFFRAGMKVEEE